ncbi:MAG: SURF1 family protein [Comamonadaceae bacterium]|nr:MAG: SURF1 family protein [Comamonadaceae bacterium]
MTSGARRGARGRALRILAALCAAALFAGFIALGTWQVHRRAWKLDLIERVNQRVHAAPVAPPAPAAWPQVDAAADEYRHVRLSGRYLPDRDTFVQASTVLGAGFWVLTPLLQADGTTVLINRGFVPTQSAQAEIGTPDAGQPDATVTVDGLLRLTEPGGGFLRSNDPAGDRWFSRDVAAIAAARGLKQSAPFFVDAGPGVRKVPPSAPDAVHGADGRPVGGLTVIAFSNSHLVYAITWYALALMVAGGAGVAVHNAKPNCHADEHPIAPND